MRNSILITAAALCFGMPIQARAQDARLALTPVFTKQGNATRIAFQGAIRNSAKNPIYFNQISVSFREPAAPEVDPTGYYINLHGPLAAGAASLDKKLFEVSLPASAPSTVYHGTVTLLGGVNRGAAGRIAQQDFVVRFSPDRSPAIVLDSVHRKGRNQLVAALRGAEGDAAPLNVTSVRLDGAPEETVELSQSVPPLKSGESRDLSIRFVRPIPAGTHEISLVFTRDGSSQTLKARLDASK